MWISRLISRLTVIMPESTPNRAVYYPTPIFITINRQNAVMANAQIDASVTKSLDRTDTKRKDLLARAKGRFEASALASGSYCVGRSDDGKPTDTRSPLSLGITISGWHVKTVFKRDDAAILRGKDWRDVEKEAKAGNIPTRIVVTENHIITAVRELKHVREGYFAETEATRALASRIIALNLSVANKPHPIADADISSVITGLKELRPIIASKDNPLKQIVSLGRMDESIRRFESVLNPSCKNRALELGRACAVLTSVPERLTAWRDSRIAGGIAYTALRETSLRVERDKWVFSQLARFTSALGRIREFVDMDNRKKDVLLRVRGMLDELDALHGPLKRLRKADKWSEGDEAKLEAAKKTLESMKTEASQTPWGDAVKRNGLKKTIRNLGRRAKRSAEDEIELTGAKKSLDEMKSEAMRLPWFDKDTRSLHRKAVRLLVEKKERAVSNAGKLVNAERAFLAKQTEAMRCIWANAGLFGGSGNATKPGHLSGDYGWLHRHIKQGNVEEARSRLDFMALFLDSNKPRYILDELSESPDSYLAPVLGHMGPAVTAFEAKDLKAAQAHFAQAALEMRKIVYPEQR